VGHLMFKTEAVPKTHW